jgi:hypothetical protein
LAAAVAVTVAVICQRRVKFRLWHSFREVPSVSDGALIAAFVIMLAVPS